MTGQEIEGLKYLFYKSFNYLFLVPNLAQIQPYLFEKKLRNIIDFSL